MPLIKNNQAILVCFIVEHRPISLCRVHILWPWVCSCNACSIWFLAVKSSPSKCGIFHRFTEVDAHADFGVRCISERICSDFTVDEQFIQLW